MKKINVKKVLYDISVKLTEISEKFVIKIRKAKLAKKIATKK